MPISQVQISEDFSILYLTLAEEDPNNRALVAFAHVTHGQPLELTSIHYTDYKATEWILRRKPPTRDAVPDVVTAGQGKPAGPASVSTPVLISAFLMITGGLAFGVSAIATHNLAFAGIGALAVYIGADKLSRGFRRG